MDGAAASEKVIVLYDRMTSEGQSRLIDRFVKLDLNALVNLTSLRVAVEVKTRRNGPWMAR